MAEGGNQPPGEPRDDEGGGEDRGGNDPAVVARVRAFLSETLARMGLTVEIAEREEQGDAVLEIRGPDAAIAIGKKGATLDALQLLCNRVARKGTGVAGAAPPPGGMSPQMGVAGAAPPPGGTSPQMGVAGAAPPPGGMSSQTPSGRGASVVLDAEGYRARREQSLATMARRLGEQCLKEGQVITLDPLSARDRRVVHMALARFPGVVTRSEGDGLERRLQIIPMPERR